jgi:solute carrier family 35 protein C2
MPHMGHCRCRSLAAVVSVITAGLLLLVYGETQFHLVGFLLVMTAAMLAGLRWTITQVLLQGTEGGGATHGESQTERWPMPVWM